MYVIIENQNSIIGVNMTLSKALAGTPFKAKDIKDALNIIIDKVQETEEDVNIPGVCKFRYIFDDRKEVTVAGVTHKRKTAQAKVRVTVSPTQTREVQFK
jgi:hypothetical protein